jgi:D-inositol-3-phosphate glycosyltransferase
MLSGFSTAIIDPVGGRCGLDHYNFGLCSGLVAAGCRVTLYTCDETLDRHLPNIGFETPFRRIFGEDRAWRRGLRYFAGMVSVFWSVVRRRERVCHFHFFQGAVQELALVIVAKMLLRRVVITIHDVETFAKPGFVSKAIIGKVYRLANKLIVHNEFSRVEVITKLEVTPEMVVVVPHGNYPVSIDGLPDAATAKQQLGIAVGSKVVLFFGQIKEVKGIDILIGAMPGVLAGMESVTFVIAGRPWKSDFSRYEAAIDAAGVRKHCILHTHFIPDEELPFYYAAADVVVLPYRRIYQSGVLLLTMSYGKAAVVSDVQGMLEIVRDGENGYVFTEASSEQLANTLIRALRNDEERHAIEQRAYVTENNDWMRIGKFTAAVYAAA